MSTKKLLKRPNKTLSKKALKKVRVVRKISTACPPDTDWNQEEGLSFISMMSVMPDGTRVAWSNCGRCSQYVGKCQCRDGVAAPRSVEYCYDRSVAALKKEEWDHKHPNYYGSLLSAQRKTSKRDHIPVMPTMQNHTIKQKPWEEIDIPPKGKPTGKTLNKPLKKLAKEATDAGAMQATATKMAKDMESKLTMQTRKSLTKKTPSKKTLKKKVK